MTLLQVAPIHLRSLPDYIQPDLDILIVGINPGLYSARKGHYYASPANRFWNAIYAAGLVPVALEPLQDGRLLEFGIGLTDVVKRPTAGIHELNPQEFRMGAGRLRRLILRYHPRIVCFNGLTGYRAVFGEVARPGLQPQRLGLSEIFVIPSTSPRNAAYPLSKIVRYFKVLKKMKDGLFRTT